VGDYELWSPVQLGAFDLRVRLEGDVATDHVVQEDAEGPDGQAVGAVPTEFDPLGRRVDSGT